MPDRFLAGIFITKYIKYGTNIEGKRSQPECFKQQKVILTKSEKSSIVEHLYTNEQFLFVCSNATYVGETNPNNMIKSKTG